MNLCRVFKLAKESAMSGEPLNYQIVPMLDAAGFPCSSLLNKDTEATEHFSLDMVFFLKNKDWYVLGVSSEL